MSDFLSHLAARSLGSVEVMRPRLASLFEPPQPAGVSDPGILNQPAISEEVAPDARPPATHEVIRIVESRPASDASDREPAARTERVMVPAAFDPQSRSDGDARSVPTGQSASASNERGVEWRPPEEPSLPAARVPDLRPVAPPPAVRAVETETVGRTLPEVPAGRSAPAPDRGGRGERSASAAATEPRRSPREPLESPHDIRPSVVRRTEPVARPIPGVSAPATIVVRPRIAPAPEPVGPPRSRRTALPGPTVHVTIGRVEVRAAHPAAPLAPRQRQAPAVMSLEEYLRRRAKGGGE